MTEIPASELSAHKFAWANAVAGLSVASLLLPEAVAYSSIANLSVQNAITALLVGLVAYAVIAAVDLRLSRPHHRQRH